MSLIKGKQERRRPEDRNPNESGEREECLMFMDSAERTNGRTGKQITSLLARSNQPAAADTQVAVNERRKNSWTVGGGNFFAGEKLSASARLSGSDVRSFASFAPSNYPISGGGGEKKMTKGGSWRRSGTKRAAGPLSENIILRASASVASGYSGRAEAEAVRQNERHEACSQQRASDQSERLQRKSAQYEKGSRARFPSAAIFLDIVAPRPRGYIGCS